MGIGAGGSSITSVSLILIEDVEVVVERSQEAWISNVRLIEFGHVRSNLISLSNCIFRGVYKLVEYILKYRSGVLNIVVVITN